MHKDLKQIIDVGWRQINGNMEEAHQVLERAVMRAAKVEGISDGDVEILLKQFRDWHVIGLQSEPSEKSPPPEGLLLRTCLMNDRQEWIDILRKNPAAIRQTVLDPHYASVAEFSRKHCAPHDDETLLKLFEDTFVFFKECGEENSRVGLGDSVCFWKILEKATLLWNAGDGGQAWGDVLDKNWKQIQAMDQIDTARNGAQNNALVSFARKRALEEVAGDTTAVKVKPCF